MDIDQSMNAVKRSHESEIDFIFEAIRKTKADLAERCRTENRELKLYYVANQHDLDLALDRKIAILAGCTDCALYLSDLHGHTYYPVTGEIIYPRPAKLWSLLKPGEPLERAINSGQPGVIEFHKDLVKNITTGEVFKSYRSLYQVSAPDPTPQQKVAPAPTEEQLRNEREIARFAEIASSTEGELCLYYVTNTAENRAPVIARCPEAALYLAHYWRHIRGFKNGLVYKLPAWEINSLKRNGDPIASAFLAGEQGFLKVFKRSVRNLDTERSFPQLPPAKNPCAE